MAGWPTANDVGVVFTFVMSTFQTVDRVYNFFKPTSRLPLVREWLDDTEKVLNSFSEEQVDTLRSHDEELLRTMGNLKGTLLHLEIEFSKCKQDGRKAGSKNALAKVRGDLDDLESRVAELHDDVLTTTTEARKALDTITPQASSITGSYASSYPPQIPSFRPSMETPFSTTVAV